MRILATLVIALAADIAAQTLGTRLAVAPVFGHHMVLQRDAEVALWGTAPPGEKLRIRLGWGIPKVDSQAGPDGRWTARFRTPGAGGPFEITLLSSSNEIRIADVMVGEVWICSGQSNMEWSVGPGNGPGVRDFEKEVAAADHPRLRLFDVKNAIAPSPLSTCEGKWDVCDPTTVGTFSATGYFFGRELLDRLDVPIGLIGTNWGGTVAESWTSAGGLAGFPEFQEAIAKVKSIAQDPAADRKWFNVNTPTALWNGMIAPLVPYGIRGAIWYQGESNRERAAQYRTLFPAMIADWRRAFGQGDFPFYYVQIAPFAYGEDTGQAAELREAQTLALAVKDTGMAVTMDIGNPRNIHPTNKQEVGRRLALWALAKTYGKDGLVHSGPLYREKKVEAGRLRLLFDHVGSGLAIRTGDALTHFEIAGEDGVFHPAQAAIDGDAVLVSSPDVPGPRSARYAWGAADEPNLMNKEGLPAPSFRTF